MSERHKITCRPGFNAGRDREHIFVLHNATGRNYAIPVSEIGREAILPRPDDDQYIIRENAQ